MFKSRFFLILSFSTSAVLAGEVNVSLSDVDALKPYCDGIYTSDYNCHGVFTFPVGLKLSAQTDVSIIASERIVLMGENVFGNANSKIDLSTTGISVGGITGIEISNSTLYGDVISYYGVMIDNSKIVGNVKTNAGDIDTKDTIIFGNTTSHSQVNGVSTNFCGDITAEGSSINLNQNVNNFVKGNVTSLFGASVLGGDVLGSISSTGLNVTIAANVYSYDNAVDAFSSVLFKNNPTICGDVKANVSVTGGFEQKCGLNDKNCSEQNICDVNLDVFNQCGFDDPLPPVENALAIVASPLSSFSLICESDKTNFTVNTFNNGQPTSLMFNATMSDVDAFSPISFVSKNGDTFLMQTNQKGELVFNLNVDNSVVDYESDYSILLSLVDDPSKKQLLKLKFAPQIFRVHDDGSPINLIAGKSEQSQMVLMACLNDSESVIASNYSGAPAIDISLIQPKNGLKDIQIEVGKFENGRASLNVLSNESGKFEVGVKDSFKCDGFLACPQSGEVIVTGEAEINSRPWTLAICGVDDAILPNGDAKNGERFVRAGELFSLIVKPIAWSGGGELDDEFNTRAYCNNKVTRNFFLDSENAGVISLFGNQATPIETASENRDKLESKGTLLKSSDVVNSKQCSGTLGYCFSELFWNEVGSLRLYSVLDRTYLGQSLNRGFIDLGRFYPSDFMLENNNIWHYPKGYDDFAYLDQPVPLSFSIIARNLNGEIVNNYAYFDKGLQAKFDNIAFDSCASNKEGKCVGELLTDRVVFDLDKADWSKDTGKFEANEIPFTLTRKVVGTSEKNEIITLPDGIFKNGFGLTAIDNIDNVDFKFLDITRKQNQTEVERLGTSFTNQPTFYYGRLNLSDVGGSSKTKISVPAIVEYWDGSRFRLNEKDNGSILNVDNENVCKVNIWGSVESSAHLASSEHIKFFSSGRYSYLEAVPNHSTQNLREQIRFYSLLDSAIPNDVDICQLPNGMVLQPWLKYNWRGKGDESPSAVVTFGVHRGNDRVIFRGEPNMYGEIK